MSGRKKDTYRGQASSLRACIEEAIRRIESSSHSRKASHYATEPMYAALAKITRPKKFPKSAEAGRRRFDEL